MSLSKKHKNNTMHLQKRSYSSSSFDESLGGLTPKKRRKKRKSLVFKPKPIKKSKSHKLPKSSSPFLHNPGVDESMLSAPLQPSISEESCCDVEIKAEICSDKSLDLIDPDVIKKDPEILDDNGRDEVNNTKKVYVRENLRMEKGLEDFFAESSSFGKNSSTTVDIKDIIYNERTSADSMKMRRKIASKDCYVGLSNTMDLKLKETIETEANESFDTENSEHGFEVYDNNANFVIILKYQEQIKLFGYCGMKVLFGKINILGSVFTKKSPEYTIYSPRGTALLTLKNNSNFCDEMMQITNLVPQLAEAPIFKDLIIRQDSTVIMLLKTIDFKLNLIEDHIAQKILPKRSSNKPHIEIEPKGSWNVISIPNDWNRIIKEITRKSRVFICGGKGVGKSTFLRYAINCLLQKYESVKVIDLDPGQSEFTVPGTLSVVTVTEPILGTNYTHLRKTERSILCDINVSLDPHKYVKCVEALRKMENEMTSNVPTLINFMGYIDDIAFHIFSSSVITLQSDKIVYLRSYKRRKNFKIKMNQESIMEYSALFSVEPAVDFCMEIIKIFSMTDDNSGWTLEARQMREMAILAYFGQSMDENIKTLQSHKLPMYGVSLSEVNVTDQHNVKIDAEAINANIVALCTVLDGTNNLFECFGWAIVRAVDFCEKKAILITPVNENILDDVTHLVVGCLTLPPSIHMNHENVQGVVPYVMEGELIDFGQMSKRSRISVKK